MHAVVVLIVWLCGVSLVQLLSWEGLLPLLAVATAAVALYAPQRGWRLIRRVRVLLAAICVLFGWFTPGEAVFVQWPAASPTREGLVLALEHGGRLLLAVCSVAILLEALSPDRLVGGIRACCRPLAVLGLAPDRLAVRLLLVLRYAERGGRDGGGDWRQWLHDVDEGGAEPALQLRREVFGLADAAVLVALFAAFAAWLAWRMVG